MLATMQHSNTALLSSRSIQILHDSKTSARDTCLLIPCALPYYNLVILCSEDLAILLQVKILPSMGNRIKTLLSPMAPEITMLNYPYHLAH